METTILYFHRLHFPSSSGQTIQVIRDYWGMSDFHQVRLFYRGLKQISFSQREILLREHGVVPKSNFQFDWVKDGFASGYFFRKHVMSLLKKCALAHPVLLVTRTLDHAKHAINMAASMSSYNIRVVLELHETAIPHLIYQQQNRQIRSFLSKRSEKKLFSRVHGIVATVQPQLDLLDQLYPDHAPAVVLPNSYQPCAGGGREVLATKGDTFLIRYAGQFSDWKNTDILFRALQHLPGPYKLEVAGGKRGEEIETRQRIERICGEFGLGGRVTYAGVLKPAEVPDFLRDADCLVLPLGDNLQSRLFTSPMKLFEYAASGTPMVVTAHPTTCSLVRDGQEAVMVKPNSATEMADAIRRIATDQDLSTRLARTAKLWVNQFSVENRVSRYNEFINFIFSRS